LESFIKVFKAILKEKSFKNALKFSLFHFGAENLAPESGSKVRILIDPE